MRLAKFNRLKLVAVSSAVVASLISSGCKPPSPGMQHPVVRPNPGRDLGPATLPSTEPTTLPATLPTTSPATFPTTAATTQATTAPTVPPVPPVTGVPSPPAPATMAATMPAAMPTTLPATAPVSPPVPQATPQSSTQPASTRPATQPTTQATSQPAIPPIENAQRPTDQPSIDADRTLAEQFAGMAEMEFNEKVTNKDAWPWIWKHQAALLSSSGELNPKESRFFRLQADALAQVHDVDGEEEALRLAIAANPMDEFSWNRRLDLILSTRNDLDKKISYLQAVIALDSGPVVVPPDVRAHAGYRLAQLLLEHGEDDGAVAALTAALHACPSCIECLQLQYRLLPASSPAYERCEHLLKLLRANPLQYQVATELADLISDNGLARDSELFYQLAVTAAHQQGDIAQHAMLSWAAAQFIADPGTRDAQHTTEALLRLDPNFTPAYFLQLVITKYNGDKDAYTKALSQAGNVIGNRVIVAINKVSPADPSKPTTRPISDPTPLAIPDLAPTVAKLKAGGSPQLKAEFVEAVADLALLDGYFAQQPESAAKLVDALPDLMPANSPQLVRLRGWNDLLAGKPDDARAKFLTVAEKDPLAELGLAKIMLNTPSEKPAAESIARKLLADHPAGLLGALLFEQLHSERVKLMPGQPQQNLQALIATFPPEMFDAAQSPRNLYDVRIVPEAVGSYIGDPLLAKVTIRNITTNDLTIGIDGLLKPEMLFKMATDAQNKPSFDAFDTIAGQTVLPAHQSINQIVRVDQTPLLSFLNTQSEFNVTVSGTLSTNQTVGGAGGINRLFENHFLRRSSVPIPLNQDDAAAELSTGRADHKISALNRLELFTIDMYHASQAPAPAVPPPAGTVTPMQVARNLKEEIHRARGDSLAAVAAWASKCELELSDKDARTQILTDIAQSPDWRHRQVALLMVNDVDASVRDAVLKQLSVDPQASVRADALALIGRYALPPGSSQTMPTTMPASKPAAAP
jgi:tetratricopeptide (TPR) repeat protein